MGQHFLTVGAQVLTLFLLMAVGFVLGRTRVIRGQGAQVLTDLALYIATPFVIVRSFLRVYDPAQGLQLLVCLGLAAALYVLCIPLIHLLLRDKKRPDSTAVLRFAAVFSNAGYMALPLQEAVLGDDGVFYGAAFIMVFNLVMWTYGLLLMSGERRLTARKLLLNPGIIGVSCGLVLFFTSAVHWLPAPVTDTVGYLGSLNTPIPMLAIGYFLSQTDLLAALRVGRGYLCMALRLAVIPLVTLGLLWCIGCLIPLPKSMGVAMVIAQSAPCAAATTMMSAKFGRDTALSVNLVALTTLLSLVTIPLIVSAALLIL